MSAGKPVKYICECLLGHQTKKQLEKCQREMKKIERR